MDLRGYLLQCSACGSASTVPPGRAGAPHRCTGCGSPLVAAHCTPAEVGERDWESAVLGGEHPAVVVVWSPACDVCADYRISVRRMAVSLYGKARVFEVNAERSPGILERYGVAGVPAVLLVRDGRVVAVLTGPQGETGIRRRLGL